MQNTLSIAEDLSGTVFDAVISRKPFEFQLQSLLAAIFCFALPEGSGAFSKINFYIKGEHHED